MLKLLLSCKPDKHATNQSGLTALDVAEQHNNRESIRILRGYFSPGVSNIKSKWEKQIVKYVAKASSIIFDDLDNISSDDRNALLVVLGLLLTGTYQATLSPPGGVWQGDYTELPKTSTDREVGTSVLEPSDFLLFYIPTYVVFMVTFFLTLALLKTFPHGFKKTIQVLLAFFAICFDQSIFFIAPIGFASKVIEVFALLFFVLTLVLFFSDRVSKPIVAILGCWLTPSDLFDFVEVYTPEGDTLFLRSVIDGCWLFLFLKDDFWEGTIIVIGCCSYNITYNVSYEAPHVRLEVTQSLMVLGCWFFLYLCRFCFKQCYQR
ncbi:hypothetical protein J1N35_036471 [Gossypium stocksii]|uniref:PGG domain-containing protein n=1 Tax=Gossypium stocksii TaxID=47602 RepID=A0A9D3UI19_9ROSI|nr:hypothetical protein J1N35_036471 [Gossypium stocksii]